MRTTIDINDALLEELRRRAAQSHKTFKEVVDETLQRGLSEHAKPNKKPKLPSYSVGIKPAYRGLSLNQVYDQLEADTQLEVAEE